MTSAPPHTPAEVVAWHDVECGHYRADLPLWRELAASSAEGPVLDVGAGTGRVAIDLARLGHAVIALDRDPELLDELRRRAQGLPVTCVPGDARELAPTGPEIDLCLVPMQTLQLFGGEDGRRRFLRAARARMHPGALLACAIVEALETFDTTRGSRLGPAPDRGRVGDIRYVSRPTAVRDAGRRWVLERERTTIAPSGAQRSHDVIELDRVTARQLQREGRAAGWRPEPAVEIPGTADHVASSVVMLRA